MESVTANLCLFEEKKGLDSVQNFQIHIYQKKKKPTTHPSWSLVPSLESKFSFSNLVNFI